jgi:uncharacterized protein YlxW (UPF0749 family)
MNVFSSGPRHKPWLWQVSALCFVLGLLLAGSLHTVGSIRRSGYGPSRVGMSPAGNANLAAALRDKDKQITALLEKTTKLETALSLGDGQAKTLNEELQKTKFLAGLTEVKGPGIVLTLRDSKKRPPSNRVWDRDRYIVHDSDIQQAVNELAASGAEAIAVNGQRVIGRTSIRCVGPTIQVNGVPISPPYEIRAIGDPNAMVSGLNLPWGLLDNMRRFDPEMFTIEKYDGDKVLTLPAYTGSTEHKYVKLVDPGRKEREASR